MKRLTEEVKKGKKLVSDGAWGTFLQQKGLESGKCPEEWNVSHRDEVLAVAKSYIEAGSDIVLTNSFGGSRFKLENYGYGDRVYEFAKAAAEISREAAGEKFVLGSIGPTGKFVMMGDVTEEELYETFTEQARGLADGGCDGVVIETFYDLAEAEAAIKAVKNNTGLEVACTFTFEEKPAGVYRTMMGVSPEDYARKMEELDVDIAGTNCGNGFAGMIPVIEVLRKLLGTKPLLVHANAGLPELTEGKVIYPETPDKVADIIPELLKAGADIIGGCCGTTPEHIIKINRTIK